MATSYLSRTFGTPTDAKKWTFSSWCKKGTNGTYHIFGGGATGQTGDGHSYLGLIPEFYGIYYDGSSSIWNMISNAFYRDLSGWYHYMFVFDSAQSTASNRIKGYINGEQITSFDSVNYPSLNYSTMWNNSGITHYLGRRGQSQGFEGSLAHVHFCDGYAYSPSDFGETDATTGIWKPKTSPSVTYGNNGFFLKFENSGSMGTDSSGNGNNFTVNGTITQNIDTPSNVFATMNPNNATLGGVTLSNGNTKASLNGNYQVFGTLQVTKGKWYWEQKINSTDLFCSVADGNRATENTATGLLNRNYAFAYRSDGNKQTNNTAVAYGDTFTTNDIIMTALDMDNGFIYWGKNGVWQNSGDPTSGATGTGAAYSGLDTNTNIPDGLTPCLGQYSGTQTTEWNFGNGYFGTTAVSSAQNPDDGIGIFEYDVPAGYRALCTKSINAEEYS